MKFDDHEIWGAPAHAADPAEPAATPVEVSAPAPSTAGTLYRSAGSEAHPDAIVALPNHHRRQHTTSQPVEATSWADTGLHAPITINSLIPPRSASVAAPPRIATPAAPARPSHIDDPAIAEVLGAQVAQKSAAPAGFTSWFRQVTGFAPEPTDASVNVVRVRSDRPAKDARAPKQRQMPKLSLGGPVLTPRNAALLAFAVTVVVGIVNAKVSTSLGAPTGIALVLSTIAAAWLLDPAARWASWTLPPYVLVAVIFVAGQFTSGAPGKSIIGQIILVLAGLITLAPWLALATVLGIVVPLLRRRTI